MTIQIKRQFNNFLQIVDFYLLVMNKLESNKYSFECEFGSVEFVKSDKAYKIIIHEIYIKEQYRNKGLCKQFIKYLVDRCIGKQIIIQSVISKILYGFLLRFTYSDGKFILENEGFVFYKN